MTLKTISKLKAPAKLNLYLEILGKRDDGYHELDSHVVFLELSDELHFEKDDELHVLGTEINDNIILRTAHKMQEVFAVNAGAKISLQKNIPLAAGLGGGSADAAATIFALKNLWNLQATDSHLYEIAKEIGADVPCCLYTHLENKNSVKFTGIGEKLTSVDAPKDLHFVLINPLKQLSTAAVFAKISCYSAASDEPNFYKRQNDMQAAAEELMPEISEILQAITSQENCSLSRMTGSGATCFGVFSNANDAQTAERKLKTHFPNYWVRYTKLI